MRIRTRLLLLVLAILLPAIVGAAISIAYIYEEQRELTHRNLRETARAMSLVLERELRERERVLQTLAGSPALASNDLRTFHEHTRAVGNWMQSSIILSDVEGRQLLNSRLPFGQALPRMTQQERDMRARVGNETVLVSNLYIPPAGLGPYSFAVQIPLRGPTGKVERFLMLGSVAKQLQGVLEAQRLPAGWVATITDREGYLVARNTDDARYVGQRLTKDLLDRLPEGEGFHHGTTLSGLRGTGFFSRAGESGWYFIVTVPTAQLQGGAIRAAALMAGLATVLLALAVLAAFVVARSTSRPMEALRRAAEQLGRSEPVQPRPSGLVEVDAVRTAMVEASDRLRRASSELEQKVAEAVASYESSQRALVQAQKLEALGRLTGGIAHDFNNVLQTLTTGLQAARLNAPEKVSRLLATCERAVARGSDLARQLMVFGRLQEVRVETFDPAQRLADATALLTGALPSNVRFVIEAPPGLWPVTADPLQLELALLNLVMNARDAMPAGGTLTLRARNDNRGTPAGDLPPGQYLALSLQDTGEGMSEEVLARAFDPFFTTKGVGKGSGIGLAQAYGFARQSGGTLVLRSQPGEGTTATLYLPRASQDAQLTSADDTAVGGLQGHGRVLLVEDDPLVRETVRIGLEVSGFEVRSATNADEALRVLESGEPVDVVFTDVVMPGSMSGIELAQLVGQRFANVRLVIATGYSDRSVDLPGVRALAKPYELQQAVAALNQALGR